VRIAQRFSAGFPRPARPGKSRQGRQDGCHARPRVSFGLPAAGRRRGLRRGEVVVAGAAICPADTAVGVRVASAHAAAAHVGFARRLRTLEITCAQALIHSETRPRSSETGPFWSDVGPRRSDHPPNRSDIRPVRSGFDAPRSGDPTPPGPKDLRARKGPGPQKPCAVRGRWSLGFAAQPPWSAPVLWRFPLPRIPPQGQSGRGLPQSKAPSRSIALIWTAARVGDR
jgi:hypothetical protein